MGKVEVFFKCLNDRFIAKVDLDFRKKIRKDLNLLVIL